MCTLLLNPSGSYFCSQELETFLEKNAKFISYVAHEVFLQNRDLCLRLGMDADDLAQIGRIKLWTKSDTYDMTNGTGYKAYCKTIMRHAMIDEIRHEYSSQKLEMEYSVELDGSESSEEICASYLLYKYELPEPSCLKKETMEELKSAIAQISDRDRVYLTYRFGLEEGEGHSLEDSAQYFHLKKNLGRKTEKEALKHLRENMP